MAKFLVVYHGAKGMGSTPEEQQALAQAWMGWYQNLGDSVVDGGNGLGDSATLRAGDASAAGTGESDLTGYLIVSAPDLEEAKRLSGGCPALEVPGGRVEIYHALEFA